MGKQFQSFHLYLVYILLCFATVVSGSTGAFGAQNSESVFGFPLKNQTVLEGYSTSGGDFGSGHRGVDFVSYPGARVSSIADGRVIFAGKVAGKMYISIDHGGDFTSTYSVMATTSVKLGDSVTKGSVIGTSSGYTTAGSVNAFMLSLRYKGKYVDPMKYLKGEIPVREISLGEIKKKDKSWFQKMWEKEKERIKDFISAGKEIFDYGAKAAQQAKTFVEWMVDKGSEVLQKGAEEFVEAYNDVKEYLDSMSIIAAQILKDKAAGLKDKVEQGLKMLRDMEKVAIEKVKGFMATAKEWGQKYAEYFKKALSFGIDAATWFYDFTRGVLTLKKDMILNVLHGIYDFGVSAVHTTFKVLDGYLDINWKMLAREVFLPYSCLAGGCVNPVKLACDPKGKFETRTEKQGYKGSGNKVMFVSGLNSQGSPEVPRQDDGTGKEADQTVRFPWKTLGYERDEVSYYTYGQPGESFESTQPNQDLFISAKTMDAQIKQWKKDNPGEKLDLITHSLGGAVTSLWLAEYYDKENKEYPPLGKVIMYAPPLTGTALSSAGGTIDSDRNGKKFHDDLNNLVSGNQFPSSAESVKQVQENGELEQILRDSKVLQKVEVYSIGVADDLIVTTGSEPIEGIHQIVLDPSTVGTGLFTINPLSKSTHSFYAHSKMVYEEPTTAAAQYILEGRKTPCVPLANSINTIVKSASVRASELTLGRAVRTGTDAVNYQDLSNFLNVLVP